MNESKQFMKRVGMTVVGVLVCGVSVGFFKCSMFGVDPFQTFCAGMHEMIPISFGTLYIFINVALLLFGLCCNRHLLGLGTFINLFLLGYVIDYSKSLLDKAFPDPGTGVRCVFLLIAIVVMCLSSAFYITADMGVSTYDAIALTIADKWKIGQFRFVRIATDLVCVAFGVILFMIFNGDLKGLASAVGIGTIITAFFMGPLIDYFNRTLAQPFLYGKKE